MVAKWNKLMRPLKMNPMDIPIGVGLLVFLVSAAGTGCTNSFVNSLTKSQTISTNTTTPGGTSNTSNQDKFVISNVTTATSGSNATPVASVFFDTSKSTASASISNHCSIGGSGSTGGKPCICQFSWNETNPNSSSSTPIVRNVQTAVTASQPALLSCATPDVFANEIPVGTEIRISILPGPSNPNAGLFSVKSSTFTKTGTPQTGSFQDSQGHSFDNVLHYSCFQKIQRGLTLTSKVVTRPNPQTGDQKAVVLASQFCVAKKSTTGASGGTGCESALPDFSSHAYYFDLYIRSSEKGDISQLNEGFVCPTVKESLNSLGTIGTQNQFWPQDATFALSLGKTPDFQVGVEANTKLSGGDNGSTSSTCSQSSSSTPSTGNQSSNGIISSCLGFAAKVNPDGTCPNLKDSSGQLRPTFRLRRYLAVYPKQWDSDGSALAEPQAVNSILVLDRPVKGPVTADPLKPYTMLGPKPCPFAFFDRNGINRPRLTIATNCGGEILATEPVAGYYATNSPFWKTDPTTGATIGKNMDGIEFPNEDRDTSNTFRGSPKGPSCSAALPILSADSSKMSITTVNLFNTGSQALTHVFVRPTQPFIPHYEEDTEFQACAPQAAPLKDAPLHFSRDSVTGNVSWCTESYPTQNPNIASIDPPVLPAPSPSPCPSPVAFPRPSPAVSPLGLVPPFTSHLVKNSASTPCTATTPTIPTNGYAYPDAGGTPLPTPFPNPSPSLTAVGLARHSSTAIVDPSITPAGNANNKANKTCDRTVSSTGVSFTRFPLQAEARDVESAIISDSSYRCTVTFDNSGGKTNASTPADGCCDKNSVFVTTGSSGASAAHLEPDVACKIPQY